MRTNVEIRIHVNAPTTRKDDDNYRAQADSYSNFQGRRADSAPVAQPVASSASPDGPPLLSDTPLDHSNPDSITYLDETQLAWTAIESQLWAGSSPAPVHTLIPPRSALSHDTPERAVNKGPPLQDSRASQQSSDTERTGSSYLRSPELERSGKRRRVDPQPATGSNAERFRVRSRPTSAPWPENGGLSVACIGEGSAISLDERADRAPDHEERASEETIASDLPTSYSLSDVTSPDSRTRQSNSLSQPKELAPSLKGETEKRQSLAGSPRTAVPPSKPSTTVQPEHRNPFVQFSKSLIRASDTSIRDFAEESLSSQLQELSTFPAQLYPPPPPTSCDAAAGTNITRALQTLADHEINAHYKPVHQTRELRPLERGAWLVETTRWPLERQITFWKYLTRVIVNGTLGWGVWCSREPGDKGELGVVRVFCWGEVVRHVYLVLYAASESQVRRLGLKWVDSDGEGVVVMPSAGD